MSAREWTEIDKDFSVRILYRAAEQAWVDGLEAEADRLRELARQTRLTPTYTSEASK